MGCVSVLIIISPQIKTKKINFRISVKAARQSFVSKDLQNCDFSIFNTKLLIMDINLEITKLWQNPGDSIWTL